MMMIRLIVRVMIIEIGATGPLKYELLPVFQS